MPRFTSAGVCLVDNPYALQWSWLDERLLGVATASRPGHTPVSGIVYWLEVRDGNDVAIDTQMNMPVGARQFAWSHTQAGVCAVMCDDARVRMLDPDAVDCAFRVLESDEAVSALDWDGVTGGAWMLAASPLGVQLYDLLCDDVRPSARLHTSFECMDAEWSTHRPLELLSAHRNGRVVLWDALEGAARAQVRLGHAPSTQAAAVPTRVSHNRFREHEVLVGTAEGGVLLYDLRAPDSARAFAHDAHLASVSAVAFNPHTEHVAASASFDRTLRLWDLRGDMMGADADGGDAPVSPAAGAAAAASAASAARAGAADAALTRYGMRVASLKPQKAEDYVNDVQWSVHETGLLAYCCNDQLVKVYDVRDA